MKKNYVLIVCLLLIGYVISSWTTVTTTAKVVIPSKQINYVELYTTEIENLVEIPIQLFSLDRVEGTDSEVLVVKNTENSEMSLAPLASGDFQSKLTGGDWSSPSSWLYDDGTGFQEASLFGIYPGLNAGTNSVTILAGHTITIPLTYTVPNEILELQIFGTLSFGNGANPQKEITINTSLVTVESTGDLNFLGPKIRFNLPNPATVIVVESGGDITGSCNNNDEIYIDNQKYAVCRGGGTGVYTFGELVANGGNINAEITTPNSSSIIICSGEVVDLEGSYSSIDGVVNVTYNWTVLDPYGVAISSLIDSGTLDAAGDFTDDTYFTPVVDGDYLISLEVTTTSGTILTNVETTTLSIEIQIPVSSVYLDAAGVASITTAQIDGDRLGSCGLTTQSISQDDFSCSDLKPVLTDLIISEYVEGSGYNKYIEIYNGTAADIDLGDYSLRLYSSGESPPYRSNTLSGNLTSGSTIVYSHASATLYSGGTINNTSVNFNGNDAIELYNDSTSKIVDVFGNIGEDPGTQWVNGGHLTKNVTLRRKSTVFGGITTDPLTGFPGLVSEWDELSVDDVSGLGSHSLASMVPVDLTVLDVNGNSADGTANVFVVDNLAPTASNPLPQNVQCFSNIVAPDIDVVTDEVDNCTATPVVAFVSDVSDGNTCPEIITRTYSVTDESGNSINVTQIITVDDTTAPVIATAPGPISIQCTGDLPAETSLAWTDNCDAGGNVTSVTGALVGGVCGGTYTRTWNIADACGNNAIQRTQIITVDDTIDPVLAGVPADVTVECSAVPAAATPTASDNCDTSVDIAYDEVRANGVCSDTYTLTRTWTATDNCGNEDIEVQVVTVQDTTVPVIAAAPGPISIECIGDLPAETSLAWTDNCDAGGNVTSVTGALVGGVCGGTYTRTWNIADACGNNAIQRTQIITVDDTIDPVLAGVPADVTVECSAVPAAATPTASDNCDTSVDIAYDEVRANGVCSDTYTLTRTWTATDNCGNEDIEVQVVTVQDTTVPVIAAAPGPISIECIGDLPAETSLAWTDNCDAGGNVTSVTGALVGGVCGGTYTRTWNIADACGNNAIQRTQIITVDDTIDPVLAGVPADVTVECSAVPAAATPTASDNCDTSVDIAYDEVRANGVCSDTYTLTRTWTATDNCGCPCSG